MKRNLKPLITSAMSKMARLCVSTCISVIAGYSCMAMENPDDRRPNEHLCPITLEVMRNPVVAADGHSYERTAISEYLNKGNHQRSPLTGAPLNNKELFENLALKTMMALLYF